MNLKTKFTVLICVFSALGILENVKGQTLTLTSPNSNGYNVSCFGASDGQIDLTITGGVPPFVIEWSNGQSSEDLTGLPAGYYSVRVDDADSQTPPVQGEITLLEPRQMRLLVDVPKYPNGFNISLYGACNATINLTISEGIGPYTFLWHDGITSQNRNSVCFDRYIVTVTDNNGCKIKSEPIVPIQPERSDWQMNGNMNTNPTSHFLGTIDNNSLSFRTNNIERLRINANGNIQFNSLIDSEPNIIYFDVDGNMNKIPFSPPSQICSGPIVMPWQQSPNAWEDIFTCYRNIGIGTDNPREKLEVKGSFIVSSWDITMNNMAEYIQLKHDGVNARIENFGAGDLLINPGNSKNVKIGTELGGGYLQTGYDTYLAIAGGKVGIGNMQPTYKLDVTGDINATNDIKINGSSILNGMWTPIASGIHYSSVSSNVGIGTGSSNLVRKLEVNGDARFLASSAEENNSFEIIKNNTTPPTRRGISLDDDPLGSFNLWINSNQTTSQFNFKDGNGNKSLMKIQSNGNVFIGTEPFSNFVQLSVCGKIVANEYEAYLNWCDFVFDEGYKRMSMLQLEEYLKVNKHLPYIKSGKIIEKEGLKIGETMQGFVQNLEETRLDVIDLYKMILQLSDENKKLKEELNKLVQNSVLNK